MFLQAAQPDSLLPCNKVPAAVVATALGGRVTNTISSGWVDEGEARCRYYLRAPGGGPDTTSRIYILYIQPAEDYDGLKEAATAPTTDVPGVGDGAYFYVDPETKRVWMNAVARGRITVTVSGPDLPSARKLAALALTRYR
ncbi:MAG TPA: hypothetical protein VGQ18_12405 [Gemmatimonadales bacterium]|nr:hypothetical protein [Gemmatimonadales bacterium]